MLRLTRFFDASLNLIALIGSALLVLLGGGVIYLGVMGFVFGMHGGPIMISVMAAFGGVSLFLGVYFGCLTYRSMQRKGIIKIK